MSKAEIESLTRAEVKAQADKERYVEAKYVSDPYDTGPSELKESLGTKYDSGKLRLDLIDPAFLTGLGSVLTYGADKYGEYNWTKGIQWTRVFGALLRHLWDAFYYGKIDIESGLVHLDHAACCLMFLRRYMTDPKYKEFDDRCKIFTQE